MNSVALDASRLRALGKEYELELCAILPTGAVEPDAVERLEAWLQAGHHGQMEWLWRQRTTLPDLRSWKPWASSVALFKAPYSRASGSFRNGGRVARYALGRDYHNLLGRRLQRLGRRLRREGLVQRFRAATDAAPVMEREWALAGALGFRGKNTLVLDPQQGPWTLLAELLLDLPMETWIPERREASCGTCRSCLDVCPTGALHDAFQLDARRCVSYLSIEHKGLIPRELRTGMGDWVFGCDLCLESCPFGKEDDHSEVWGTTPALLSWTLEDLVGSTRRDFDTAFAGSPLRRAGWVSMVRNACIALANLGRGVQALEGAVQNSEPLIRAHAIWSLGKLGAFDKLRKHRQLESNSLALKELELALDES